MEGWKGRESAGDWAVELGAREERERERREKEQSRECLHQPRTGKDHLLFRSLEPRTAIQRATPSPALDPTAWW